MEYCAICTVAVLNDIHHLDCGCKSCSLCFEEMFETCTERKCPCCDQVIPKFSYYGCDDPEHLFYLIELQSEKFRLSVFEQIKFVSTFITRISKTISTFPKQKIKYEQLYPNEINIINDVVNIKLKDARSILKS
jgi:hypothetical protein